MREQLVTDFDKIISDSNFSKKDIELKRISLDKFIEDGFPTKKKEDWKFLDINRAIEKNIGQLDFYNDYSFQNKIDTSSFVKGLEHNKIVFINGRIEKIDFKSEDNNKIEIIEESNLSNKFNNINSLINLNNAFTNKNYKINVKENYSLKKPLIVYHLTTNKIYKKNINLRLNFNLESNSSLRLIDYFEDNSKDNFINIFYNFDLEKNSILKNYKIDHKDNKNV